MLLLYIFVLVPSVTNLQQLMSDIELYTWRTAVGDLKLLLVVVCVCLSVSHFLSN